MNWTTQFARRLRDIGHSDVVEILKLVERPEVTSFAGGLPDPATFLISEIKEIAQEILETQGVQALSYSPTPGLTPLREWLAQRMSKQGRPTAVDEVIVTTGGIAALDLIAKTLLDPSDVVVVGEPEYVAALHVFRSYQARFVGVPVDAQGLVPEALMERLTSLARQAIRPKLIYTVPSFQNPSGATLPESRRRDLLDIAGQFGIPVVEDEAYRDLRFEGEAPPLLAALDPGNVIHINTFSKIFYPGVRVGWAVAPKPLIDALILGKQGQDQCSSTLGQYLALAFAQRNLIDRQIESAIPVYRRKRDALLGALADYFPPMCEWVRPEGGFYTWVKIPKGLHAQKLLTVAIEKARVAYVPGNAFYHDRNSPNTLRLCYSYVQYDQIAPGIQRLGELISAAAARLYL